MRARLFVSAELAWLWGNNVSHCKQTVLPRENNKLLSFLGKEYGNYLINSISPGFQVLSNQGSSGP